MNIGIRVDGNSAIGFGHLVRMEALARQFKANGHEVVFFGQVYPSDQISVFPIFQKPENAARSEELAWLWQKVTEQRCQIIIIDSYDYQEQELDQIGRWPVYSVYYDDLNRHLFSVNCVVNGNLFGDKLLYQGTSLFLLGKDYALLRAEFAEMPIKITRDNVYEATLTMGGADAANATPVLIEWLKELQFFSEVKFNIVIGPAFINKKAILEKTGNLANMIMQQNADMAELIKNSDMVISAAGQTVNELLAGGAPSLLIVTADNQALNAKTAAELGCAINLGSFSLLTKEAFLGAFDIMYTNNKMRRDMSQKGQSLIDGQGASRLAACLIRNA